MNVTPLPDRYTSKGKVISKSKHHKDMYIVEVPGGFYTISSSDQTMRMNNPPDKPKSNRVRGTIKMVRNDEAKRQVA
jgi:hypothetical protein